MKKADLTVSGFYKHFTSRDALVAEALGSALGAWRRQAEAAAAGGPPFTYNSLVDEYLSERHRDHPGTDPIGALAADIARSDKRTRVLVTRQVRDSIELIVTLIRRASKKHKRTARSEAVLTYCALIGAYSRGPRGIGRASLEGNPEDRSTASEANSLCTAQERHTMCGLKFPIANFVLGVYCGRLKSCPS